MAYTINKLRNQLGIDTDNDQVQRTIHTFMKVAEIVINAELSKSNEDSAMAVIAYIQTVGEVLGFKTDYELVEKEDDNG